MKSQIKVFMLLILLSSVIVFTSAIIKGEERNSPLETSSVKASGIDIQSVKPSAYNAVSFDGLLVITFKSSLKLKIEASLIKF